MERREVTEHEIQKYGCTKAERDRIQRVYGGETWHQSPFGVFSNQRKKAKARGDEWTLTFYDWWEVWYYSGRWNQRGVGRGKYCMARLCHDGPYEYGNVHIIPAVDSVMEAAAMRAVGIGENQTVGQRLTEKDKQWLKDLEDSLP